MNKDLDTNRVFCRYCKGPLDSKQEIKQQAHNSCKIEIATNSTKESIISWLRDLINWNYNENDDNQLQFAEKTATDYFGLDPSNLDESVLPSIGYIFLGGFPVLKIVNYIPDSIDQLINLKGLSINYSTLEFISSAIGNLQFLERIYIQYSMLTELPDTIGKLSNLTSLLLGGNRLKVIPDSIGQLKNLTNIELGGNQISELPVSIGNLSKLKGLGITNNNLISIPDSIGQFNSLESLFIGINNLTILPETIGNLSKLK